MTDHGLPSLRRQFLERYDDLKARLTQRLGSADLAGDAMQDTWLRLARTESIGVVQSPRSYLFRIVERGRGSSPDGTASAHIGRGHRKPA